MSKKVKKDKRTPHEKTLIGYAEELGFSVYDWTGVGNGVPDLLVAYGGVNVLVECKQSEEKTLSGAQQEWHCNWNGVIHVWSGYLCVQQTMLFCQRQAGVERFLGHWDGFSHKGGGRNGTLEG